MVDMSNTTQNFGYKTESGIVSSRVWYQNLKTIMLHCSNPIQQFIRSAIFMCDLKSFHHKVKGCNKLAMVAKGNIMQVVDESDWPPP